jgi:hypothetical protein
MRIDLVHFLDGVASALLGVAITMALLGGVKVYHVLMEDASQAMWVYSVATMGAVGWAVYRKVFGRSP